MAFRSAESLRQRNAIGLFRRIVSQSGMQVWGEVDSLCSTRAVTRRWCALTYCNSGNGQVEIILVFIFAICMSPVPNCVKFVV